MSNKAIESLRQTLSQEDTVLFVGSGVSLWSGLPTWSAMIEELAQFVERNGHGADLVREEASRGDLLQAASYGFDRLTKSQIGDFIRAACRYGKARPHEIHKKIVSLGPRCFITTNYDNLIEQSLQLWQPERFYPQPVTNRHLTETAGIVHARSIDFIFKPHGDASDSESIILTREQYRQLLPQGERQAALESVKMLLASRPIVYIGFGLRDPDFIYLRDLLANTYKGGIREHYAIMPNIQDQEIDYWRRNYGIKLINYVATKRIDKTHDHSALLGLLDSLMENRVQQNISFNPKSSDAVLALARHAAALSREPKLNHELAIRVRADAARNRAYSSESISFHHTLVNEFLTNGPSRAVLTGLPGAGKSYSMRRAAAVLADHLHQACLDENPNFDAVVVPLIVDLKLYNGNIKSLVAKTLPSGLPINEVINHFSLKVFLDSFNEIPRIYLEDGSCEKDLESFVSEFGKISILIGSRTTDGLGKLGWSSYTLDYIDESIVRRELEQLDINIKGRFERDIVRLLQRPFFFKYVISGLVALQSEPHPRDFYKSIMNEAQAKAAIRFGENVDIEFVLCQAAYESLNRGEEAFPLSTLVATLSGRGSKTPLLPADVNILDFINWLISASILVPYSGGRVAFVHQSVTEYLAATELARRYLQNPGILLEKIVLNRWDQSLLFTLSLLPPEQEGFFLDEIVRCDLILALNAAKYVEHNRDAIVEKLLVKISEEYKKERFDRQHQMVFALSNLPVELVHEQKLRHLMEFGGSLGGAAVKKLVSLKGESVKYEVLSMLKSHSEDYNFCRYGVAEAIGCFIVDGDAELLAAWTDEVIKKDGDKNAWGGFLAGAAEILSKISIASLKKYFMPGAGSDPVPYGKGRVLCRTLEEIKNTDALNLAADLLCRELDGVATAIYFIGNFPDKHTILSWEAFGINHVLCLEKLLSCPNSWSVNALMCLCAARADLASFVSERANQKHNFEAAVMKFCANPKDISPVFVTLESLLMTAGIDFDKSIFNPLTYLTLDWSGRENLFIRLMESKQEHLVRALVGTSLPPNLRGLGKVEIVDINHWLHWIQHLHENGDGWLSACVAAVLGKHANQNTRKKILLEFSNEDCKFRKILLRYVLPYCEDISTDIFGEGEISFLLADLCQEGAVHVWKDHLLGSAATERFVEERLLPLLPQAEDHLLKNIRLILDQAGRRHGRRHNIA